MEQGSFTAVLGASGSGKTTLLRVIAGFERIESGVVRLGTTVFDDGRTSLPPERRRIGYVPQDGALFPHLRVAANVGFGLPRSSRRKVGALLEAVGLTGLERRYPHQLSGGQQQRVALARALAIEPEVVLLDEPFSSLDAAMRASVRQEVAQILRARGTTTVLVTHDQDEALSMAERVAVLADGRIVANARPEELYRSPLDADLAGFVGEANLLPGHHRGRGGPHRPRPPGAAGSRSKRAGRGPTPPPSCWCAPNNWRSAPARPCPRAAGSRPGSWTGPSSATTPSCASCRRCWPARSRCWSGSPGRARPLPGTDVLLDGAGRRSWPGRRPRRAPDVARRTAVRELSSE